MPEIEFVPANESDIPTLLRIEESASGRLYSPYSESDLRQFLSAGERFYLIKRDGDVLGSASVETDTGESIEFGSLVLLPEFRVRGLGVRVFRSALRHFQSRGYTRIHALVHPDNISMLRIYFYFGFKEARRIDNAFGDGEPRLELLYQS